MKNRKGFTLIELLATIVILGVIMGIAVSNVVSTLDKNKKDSFIKDAKTVISAAEFKLRSDTRIEYPDQSTVIIFPLKSLRNVNFEASPYNTYYSKEDSFVAITKEVSGADYEIVYYVHLVSCEEETCLNEEQYEGNRGINLVRASELSLPNRFERVVSGEDVELELLRDSNYSRIKTIIQRSNVVVY